MDIQDQNKPVIESNTHKTVTPKSTSVKIIVFSIILSLIFGGIGGTLGSLFFLRSSSGKKLLPELFGAALNQKVTLNEDSATIDVVKKARPAVVSIIISQDLSKIPGYGIDPFFDYFYGNGGDSDNSPNIQEVGAGSGFFVSDDGLILTNKHVVSTSNASYTVLTQDGTKYDAKVAAVDPVNDLAIVKIDIKDAPYLNLSDSSKIQVGQHVIAIGNSLGQYQNSVTTGIISGIGRSITAGSENLSGVIQTDAAINPGNSGGPLLDFTGQVVGINTAIDQEGQLVGFAIPANEGAKSLASFKKNGKITSAFLGVRFITLNADIAKQNKLPKDFGALIVNGKSMTDFAVLPGSPADKAGLMENDIILEVNGKQVNEDNLLPTLLSAYNPGDVVTLKVYHKGSEKDIKVTLGETK